MASIFTKIIKGEIPSYKIAESEDFYAFLDIFPIAKGHTLVVPKKEIDHFFDLDDDLLARIMPFAQKVAKALKATIPCNRIGVSVIGLEVPHAHVHLVPINQMSDISFEKEKLQFSKEEMEALAKAIRANLE
jgi:histidine triad (HIT) family protein